MTACTRLSSLSNDLYKPLADRSPAIYHQRFFSIKLFQRAQFTYSLFFPAIADMTFCLSIAVNDGIVGVADTLVTSGLELITARKLSTYHPSDGAMFLMTSGLRSIRDKALTYFEIALDARIESFDNLYEVVNLFAVQLRKVRKEDREWLQEDGLQFNSHALVGGQMRKDKTHKLYLVYPEGNWVDTSRATPYHVIGSTGYGKPILDRTLQISDPIQHAFKVACLAFDSTRISASDVDFPIDVVLYRKDSFKVVEHRYYKEDLDPLSTLWQEHIRSAVQNLPMECQEKLFLKIDKPLP